MFSIKPRNESASEHPNMGDKSHCSHRIQSVSIPGTSRGRMVLNTNYLPADRFAALWERAGPMVGRRGLARLPYAGGRRWRRPGALCTRCTWPVTGPREPIRPGRPADPGWAAETSRVTATYRRPAPDWAARRPFVYVYTDGARAAGRRIGCLSLCVAVR